MEIFSEIDRCPLLISKISTATHFQIISHQKLSFRRSYNILIGRHRYDSEADSLIDDGIEIS